MSTIAAISTAIAPAGIGVIRVSGEDSINIVDKVFKSIDGKKLHEIKGYTAKFGYIFEDQTVIDQVVVLVFRAPKSYTGENVVEISCHGGVYIVKKILNLILNSGATLAQPGEFTKRAFLNGKIDLSEAESVMNLISAQGKKASTIAIGGLEGKLNKKIEYIKNNILEIVADLTAWIDYPDEDIPQLEVTLLKNRVQSIKNQLTEILQTFSVVEALTHGLKIAVMGRPNVGKSSLLNLILGFERAIVTNIPGTTRDVLEAKTFLGDIPVTLFDTAGIHDTVDVVEKIGVDNALKCLKDADLIFVLFDGSKPLNEEDFKVVDLADKNKSIAVINKSDLPRVIDIDQINKIFNRVVCISVVDNLGIDELKNSVYNFVGADKVNLNDAVVSGQRQFDVVRRAVDCLDETILAIQNGVTFDAVTVQIQDSLNVLAEITGENVSENVINAVFSKFCLGK